jgi:imidazole glycerol-phosphate synthase subunit HisF
LASRRVIGAIAVHGGRVVKSYGYRARRPAGSIGTALTNLDRWGADEILLLDISRRPGVDPSVRDAMRDTPLSTPLTYGGGIRSVAHVREVLDAGADRVLIESLLWEDPDEVARIAEVIGAQAVVASLPVAGSSSGRLFAWSPSTAATARPDELSAWVERIGRTPCEEVLVIDVDAEGSEGSFSLTLATELGPVLAAVDRPTIWFGGLDATTATAVLTRPDTTGVAIGNPLVEGELVLPELRAALRSSHPDLVRAVRPSRG